MTEERFRPALPYPPQPFYPFYPQPESPHMLRGLTPSDQIRRFYGDPNLHMFCLKAITRLHKTMYSGQVVRKIQTSIGQSLPTLVETCFNDSYAFFLKGSNAMPLLQMEYNSKLYGRVQFPRFVSDFDCTLLINPQWGAHFKTIREILITELVYTMIAIVQTPFYWAVIQDLYKESELPTPFLGETNVQVKHEALSPEDFDLATFLYNGQMVQTVRTFPGCPFQVVIHPNLQYGHMPLGFALVKIQTRTTPPLDILDVSIPSSAYADLRTDWKIHRGLRLAIEPDILFYVSDFLYTYVDYRMGAKKNTRVNKSRKRKHLANTLRNTILRNLVRHQVIPKERLAAMRAIPEVRNMINL